MQCITVIDSHTGGEPTRVVVEGVPDLVPAPCENAADRFHQRFDHFRAAVVNEPRGSDVLVVRLAGRLEFRRVRRVSFSSITLVRSVCAGTARSASWLPWPT